jgi:hypothetical protein
VTVSRRSLSSDFTPQSGAVSVGSVVLAVSAGCGSQAGLGAEIVGNSDLTGSAEWQAGRCVCDGKSYCLSWRPAIVVLARCARSQGLPILPTKLKDTGSLLYWIGWLWGL